MVKQISIFIENKPGKLHAITTILSENNINIRALSIADTTDFGILRLIVNTPDEAKTLLRDAGYTVKITQVAAIEVADRPGGLATALAFVKDAGVVIEYMYAFICSDPNKAMVILKLNDMEKGIQALKDGNITVFDDDTVYNI